ncbi:recombinase RecR [Peptoniphilus indolicus]|nr:recombinase RecR [Peptoniphilus indolicus]
MKKTNEKKHRKIKFEIKRVYVGETITEVFEEVIEHIVDKNLEEKNKKQTQD